MSGLWRALLAAGLASAALTVGCGGARSSGALGPDTSALARRARRRLPPDFTVLQAPPFVVVGDGQPEEVELLASLIVERASRSLERQYFDRRPRHAVTVWMLSGDNSYQSNADAYLGQRPLSPYGYYSPRRRAVVVNTALGAGTLIHEITHVLLRASFPAAPVWFDEGLASLYEQTHFEGERLVGENNWRLPPLQRALEEGAAPPLIDVMRSSRRSFYREPTAALAYATARYLCHFLQARGVLERYFREFRAAVGSDPDGVVTLERLFGASLGDVERAWRGYVLALAWPVSSGTRLSRSDPGG